MPCAKVAMEIQYDGTMFQGLAFQSMEAQRLTVENLFIAALKEGYLIPPDITPKQLQFSRAGRTDAGVSATGQVFCFYIRAQKPTGTTFGDILAEFKAREDAIAAARVKGIKQTIQDNSDDGEVGYQLKDLYAVKPVPYDPRLEQALQTNLVEAINNRLPEEIRVLRWTLVHQDFDARFAARWRSYRYYLPNCTQEQLAKLNFALDSFRGERDFRNLCYPQPGVENFTRRLPVACATHDDELNLTKLEFKGSAFLYHQVRCMTAIAWLYANERISEATLTSLFDFEATPARPFYNMAPAEPLTLTGVGYDEEWGFKWNYNKGEQYIDRDAKRDAKVAHFHRLQSHNAGGDWLLSELGANDRRFFTIIK